MRAAARQIIPAGDHAVIVSTSLLSGFIHYPEEDKPFEARLKSSLQRTSGPMVSPYTQAVRRGEEAVMRVNTIHRLPNITRSMFGICPIRLRVKYPDGTQYAYANSEVKLHVCLWQT